ncbi:formate/nitrite transporter family protein [Gleimia sp. 6138-11-ORH1]|uniref:formate/nitrite transporter family protein n=1 Tax=Gleimia sp. 6138-11-ORH1 TaxID=2973937 RepID=UPI002166C389|nr:formate/nitrite transporter family protein [Gleimia sp. 6138-11-ORH1]MCS4485100.1 formate/nitrite transporter family protein [Gleimia sp. 6138-11-ORH1]
MLNLQESLAAQMESGHHKAAGINRPLAFAVATLLGGIFIGIADILMFTAAGPFYVAQSPAAPLLSGLVFGLGLVLVVFAGGELATSAMMALPQAVAGKQVALLRAVTVLMLILLGNLVGSVLLAALVSYSGVFAADTAAGGMLEGVVAAKVHKSDLELFVRGIMCNVLVCLAIWSQARTQNDVAKILLMGWAMFAFVTSGFEHVVANMTTFSLGLFLGVEQATLFEAARNWLIVGAGNLVGGAVFIGGAYLLVGGPVKEATALVKRH